MYLSNLFLSKSKKKRMALLLSVMALNVTYIAQPNNAMAEQQQATETVKANGNGFDTDSNGNGNSDLQTYALDQMVVTANKQEEKVMDANANVSVITKDDIERMHYSTVEEALRTMTNVQFLNYNLPGYNLSKVRINGSDQVVVLVDGVRVSMTGTGQEYPFHLVSDMENIERIEVLKGSAAVLYGSDAKGGVINIITKKNTQQKTKFNVSSGNFGKEEYKLSTEGKVGKTSYRIYGQKAISGDFKDGNSVKWNTHDNAENAGIMLRQELSEGSDITLNYTHGDDDYAFIDRLYNQDIKGNAKSKNLQITYKQKLDDTLTNTLSYNNARYQNVGNLYSSYRPDPSTFWSNNYKTTLINDTLTKTFGDTHTVMLGFEHIKSENLDPQMRYLFNPFRIEYYKQSLKNTSWFLQDNWKMDDRWNLNSGIRYDKPSGGEVDIDSNIAKSFSLGYKFNDNSNMYVAYNDYFVLPSMYQLYDSKYGNAKLLPKQGKNYEVGFNHKFDDTTMMSFHWFKRNSDRNIGFSTEADTYINDSEQARGFDVQFDKYFDDVWHASLGYSRLSYDNVTGTTDYGYLPKNLVTIGVDYTKDKWNVGIDGRGFLGRDGKDVKSYGWPSDRYWVFNAGINYKPEENLKVFAKINNIFNQEYAEQTNAIWWGSNPGDWYGMPGRNFVVGMEMEF